MPRRRVPSPVAGWWIVELAEAGSTNDEARRLAEAGDPGRVAVVALRQTAGRGRLGRPWVSPVGGLYLSALTHPRLPAHRAGLVPLAAGLALARVVEGLGLRPELRWPNDVLLGGRKLAGVLCESRFEEGGRALAWAVVGMGLNVATPPAALAEVGGVSLAEALGGPLDPAALRQPVLAALDDALALAVEDADDLIQEWSSRAPMLGRLVELVTTSGPVGGLAERVGPTGALVVRLPGGPLEITDPDLIRVQS